MCAQGRRRRFRRPALRRRSPRWAPSSRSNFLASLLILPLLFVGLRLAMVPVADGFLRGMAVRAAAHKLGVNVEPDSQVGSWAGWLRLPWPSIMVADKVGSPAALFDPANKGTVPAADFRDYFVSSFTRTLVLLTWWLFGVLGAVLLWRRSGILDAPWGFIAGSVAGLAGMATFACAFLVLDVIPQFVWHVASHDSGGPAGWLGWVLLAVLSWLLIGVAAGIVATTLPPLRRLVLLPLQRIPAALLRGMGLRTLADFWWTP